eukprot:COSAG01_NODE_555_length_15533_cov_35.243310_10_plen_87_part_00
MTQQEGSSGHLPSFTDDKCGPTLSYLFMGCASSTAVDQQQAANNDHMEPNYFLPAGTLAALPAAHRDVRGQQQPGGEYTVLSSSQF